MYDNEESDVYYFPNLVTLFYTHIDTSTIDHDLHTFIVYFDSGDFVVNINTIDMITRSPVLHNMMHHGLSLNT